MSVYSRKNYRNKESFVSNEIVTYGTVSLKGIMVAEFYNYLGC
jgi:hypothetical protein